MNKIVPDKEKSKRNTPIRKNLHYLDEGSSMPELECDININTGSTPDQKNAARMGNGIIKQPDNRNTQFNLKKWES